VITRKLISRKILLFVLVMVVLLVSRGITPSPAKAEIPTDGRINLIPWVNGHGAIAVYCVNQFDRPAGSFTGGGIKFLGSSGQKLFFAAEKLITAAQVLADKLGRPVLILTQGLYSLYALPNGYFQINSAPDNEGKTFIARWYGCTPVGPGPEAAGACVQAVPLTIEQCRDEEPYFACLAANNGNPDCNGNPQDNDQYCRQNCQFVE